MAIGPGSVTHFKSLNNNSFLLQKIIFQSAWFTPFIKERKEIIYITNFLCKKKNIWEVNTNQQKTTQSFFVYHYKYYIIIIIIVIIIIVIIIIINY
jgi:hypothetical protein